MIELAALAIYPNGLTVADELRHRMGLPSADE